MCINQQRVVFCEIEVMFGPRLAPEDFGIFSWLDPNLYPDLDDTSSMER